MLKKIGKTLYYIFFGALILVALVVAVSAFPVKGNIQIKVVESGSMEPNIKTGAVVLMMVVHAPRFYWGFSTVFSPQPTARASYEMLMKMN